MKKAVALLLCLVLFTAVFAVNAGAADENDFNSGYIPDDTVRLTDEPNEEAFLRTTTEGYYLVGSMTGWKIDPAYRLSLNDEESEECVLYGVHLTTGDEFKIVYSTNGKRIDEWFPDGMGNNCTLYELSVGADGYADLYFRPDMDGGDGWYFGCIRIGELLVPEPTGIPDPTTAKPTCPVIPTAKPTEPAIPIEVFAGTEEPTTGYVPEPTEPVELNDLDRMTANRYESSFRTAYPFSIDLYSYDEIYYHHSYEELYDHQGRWDSVDWALVRTKAFEWTALDGESYGVFDEIVVYGAEYYPFSLGFGVYDVAKDAFYSIEEAWNKGYDGLHDVFVLLAPQYAYTKPLGDADSDGELTIIDVTHIQRFLAGMEELENDEWAFLHITHDFGPAMKYLSDFDCDGEREIIDATRIQRHLVGLSIYPHRFTTNLKLEDPDGVLRAAASSAFTNSPVQYRYEIRGVLHAYSYYDGADFGRFDYIDPDHEYMPGEFYITTGFIDDTAVRIPVRSLTPNDSFKLTVTARDSRGQESSAALWFNTAY